MGHPLFVLSLIEPRNLIAVSAEVIEGAARPGHGEAETFFGAGASGGIFSTFVEGHDDVSAESDLDVDGMFRSEEVRAAIEMGAELDAVVRDFAESVEGEDLEAAGVSEDGARPTHEFVKPAHAVNLLVTRAQIKVIGVAEDDFDAERFERVLRDGFDGALRADGHEDGGFDGLMGQEETAAAATGGCGFRENLELKAHQRILSVRLGWSCAARELVGSVAEVDEESGAGGARLAQRGGRGFGNFDGAVEKIFAGGKELDLRAG